MISPSLRRVKLLSTLKIWNGHVEILNYGVARNKKYPDDQCPKDVLKTAEDNILCEWLCKYVTETCKSDGKSTLHGAYAYY